MAELSEDGGQSQGHGKKRGGVRAKKMSTRIDMTPMVDLGFLLVTFFILTTTMNKPKAMNVALPDLDTTKQDKPPEIRRSEVTTYLLGANDRIFYYNGDSTQIKTTNFKKIRSEVLERNTQVKAIEVQNHWLQKDGTPNGVYVLIKPTNQSHYENLVNFLDEMKITGVKSYSILTPTSEELKLLPQ